MQNDKNRIREQRIYSRGHAEALKSLGRIVDANLDKKVKELIKDGYLIKKVKCKEAIK